MEMQSVMATLIERYLKVYQERQKLMKELNHLKFERNAFGRFSKPASWYEQMMEHSIEPFYRSGHFFIQRWKPGSSPSPRFFRSERAKQAAVKELAECAWLQPEELQAKLQDLLDTQVHPHASTIIRYGKLKGKLNALSAKKNRLCAAIKELNTMNLGVRAVFGSKLSHYATDRIALVAVGEAGGYERIFKPKEFIEHALFESTLLK